MSGTGGEGGTSRREASAAGKAITQPIQKSHDTSRFSTITPASGSPIPAPIPNIALSRPIAPGTRSRGKVSRMIPKASGNTPPATPCTTRPAISSSIDGASAHTTDPTEKVSIVSVSTRPLP